MQTLLEKIAYVFLVTVLVLNVAASAAMLWRIKSERDLINRHLGGVRADIIGR